MPQIQLPFGIKAVKNAAYPKNESDSTLENASAFIDAWFNPKNTGLLYPGRYPENTGKINLELNKKIIALQLRHIDSTLTISGYSVLGKDTLIYITDRGRYSFAETDELTTFVNYTCLATIKNRLPNDFLLLSYVVYQPYLYPQRHFYFDSDTLFVKDIELGELQELVSEEKYVIRNGRFIKNPGRKKDRNFCNVVQLTNKYKIGFLDSIKGLEYNYCQPFLISHDDTVKIRYTSEEEEFCGFTGYFTLSPNGKYTILERIERGYVTREDGTEELHENYFCWLIDLETHSVFDQYQSDCGGEWNNKNEWINNDKILFSPN